MADMLQAMKAGQTSSGMVQLAGGVEQIERITPQPGPAPCPPGQVPVPCLPVDLNAPMGPPVAVHEPAPGQLNVIEVIPNQPLIFDFNPLDLQATQHDGSVVLTFPDGAQIELHDIVGPCGVQPTPFQLPDGTVITPGDLLQAFHLEVLGPCGLVAPTPIVPHEVPNTGFYVNPFEVGGIGEGILGLGPLAPTGFGYSNEFLKGTGGSHTTITPPGPPGPTPPSGLPPTAIQDAHVNIYGVDYSHSSTDYSDGTVPPLSLTSNYFSDTDYGTGHLIVTSASGPPSISEYFVTGTPGSAVLPGTALTGQYGTLTFDTPATNGGYTYEINNAGSAIVSQLATDGMSEAMAQQGLPNLGNYVQDSFNVVISNAYGSDGPAGAQLYFDIYGTNVFPVDPDTGQVNGVSGVSMTTPAATSADILLTYTDAVDPAHSFQTVIPVTDTGAGTFNLANADIPIQPNDPALVSLEYMPGSTGTVTVTGLTVAGEAIGGGVLGPGGTEALTAVINPNLSNLTSNPDPGDLGNTSNQFTLQTSQDSGTPLTLFGTYDDTGAGHLSNYTASGYSAAFGYLYDSNAIANPSPTGAGNVDIVNYADDSSSAVSLTGSTAPSATSVIEWSSAASINSSTLIDGGDGSGGTGVNGNLNVLEIESSTTQNLDNADGVTFGTGNTIANIEVFNLTDAAGNPAGGNSITLTSQDVFNVAQNEPTAVLEAGGALSIWVLGTGSDTVTLSNTTGAWSAISGSAVSGNPLVATQGPTSTDPNTIPYTGGTTGAAVNSTQMVGFTEYSAHVPAGETVNGLPVNTVHVYVENAIAQAGHVHHA